MANEVPSAVFCNASWTHVEGYSKAAFTSVTLAGVKEVGAGNWLPCVAAVAAGEA